MAVLDLGSKESLQTECSLSDFVNLRGSPKPILSVKWKRDSWHRFLFGRICLPSRTESFEDWWILQLRESLASRTATLESTKAGQTSGSSSTTGCEDLSRCNQEPSSSRTSKGYFRVECQTELFASPGRLRDWKQWVIGLRQAYSQRVNAVRVTNAGEYSSLPTPCANEDSFRLNGSSQQSKTLEARARRGELMTTGSVQPVERVSLRGAGVTMLNLNVLPALSGHIHLFTNPQLMDALNVAKTFRHGLTTPSGPLSPSFVEVMMGLPVGWTDYDSSATELCQQQPL